jgi:hypothetical protein
VLLWRKKQLKPTRHCCYICYSLYATYYYYHDGIDICIEVEENAKAADRWWFKIKRQAGFIEKRKRAKKKTENRNGHPSTSIISLKKKWRYVLTKRCFLLCYNLDADKNGNTCDSSCKTLSMVKVGIRVCGTFAGDIRDNGASKGSITFGCGDDDDCDDDDSDGLEEVDEEDSDAFVWKFNNLMSDDSSIGQDRTHTEARQWAKFAPSMSHMRLSPTTMHSDRAQSTEAAATSKAILLGFFRWMSSPHMMICDSGNMEAAWDLTFYYYFIFCFLFKFRKSNLNQKKWYGNGRGRYTVLTLRYTHHAVQWMNDCITNLPIWDIVCPHDHSSTVQP